MKPTVFELVTDFNVLILNLSASDGTIVQALGDTGRVSLSLFRPNPALCLFWVFL